MLGEDKSVASGRAMEQIADGKGRAPKPFMLAKGAKAKADAVWQSNRAEEPKGRTVRPAPGAALKRGNGSGKEESDDRDKRETSRGDAGLRRAAALHAGRAAAGGDGWCHEIKFDGYRVQLRVEDGKATLKTRKGLDWTDKFAAIAKEAAQLPDAMIDGEIVALDHKRRAEFLVAAGRAVGRQDRGPDLLCLRSPVRRGRSICARLPLGERKDAAQATAGGTASRNRADPLCRAFRERRRRGAAIGLQARARRHRLEEARCALPLGAHGRLDQGQVPRRP